MSLHRQQNSSPAHLCSYADSQHQGKAWRFTSQIQDRVFLASQPNVLDELVDGAGLLVGTIRSSCASTFRDSVEKKSVSLELWKASISPTSLIGWLVKATSFEQGHNSFWMKRASMHWNYTCSWIEWLWTTPPHPLLHGKSLGNLYSYSGISFAFTWVASSSGHSPSPPKLCLGTWLSLEVQL